MKGKDTADYAVSKSLIAQSVNLDEAIELTGFGKCQYYMLFVSCMFFMSSAISLTSVSFIMLAAQCDFKMMSVHKGLLNGASMIGIFFGSFTWGYVADTKGRKFVLITCMLIDGVFNVIAGVSQIYPVLVFCRLMSGFGVAGGTVVYLYLGEFLSIKIREKYLCWAELFWTFGIILLPCIAWLIIPLTFRIEYGFFLFRSWNLFTIVCALPSIISACLLMKFPETPKFLLVMGKHDETIACLKFIYRLNNNGSDDKFPVTSVVQLDNTTLHVPSKGFFSGLYGSVVGLFKSKYRSTAIITFIIHFCGNASYYMMTLWFPELINRFRLYETSKIAVPQNEKSMCEIVSMFKVIPEKTKMKCIDYIENSVYMNILIIGVACLPSSIIVPLFVSKFGIRFFLVLSFIMSGISAACLYFITSSTQNLVIASVFEALSSMGMNLIYCIAIELFPTEYRGMATSMGCMFGKVGGVVGNIIIGLFIDAHCTIPIVSSCSFLIIAGLLIFTLPSKSDENRPEIKS
ncbi:Major facilitator superfamily,Major facilitator superfamily domain,Major facilitator, sugar transporter- [Cinara cedri]|uniref:Major facilitator superfamily,Major facilitator superfamily domain,Major facilitator, sugar transporter n=1 Tax=Cinara cedri TaxID=506608 RepID=A0A5E4MX99_9HEMI|nr:Major facilitator superfamily,Major facilitator superfamily domain,Major facilitator, sugar transporter- [Cinara cedri]